MPEEVLTSPGDTPPVSAMVTRMEVGASFMSAGQIFCQVVTRQINDELAGVQQAPIDKGEDDPVLDTIECIVNGIKHGADLSGLKDEIERLINNQDSRAELINNMLLTHDYSRLPGYLRSRFTLESFLQRCAMRGDLTPPEALTFLKLVQQETEAITTRIRSGATKVRDIDGLVNKADFLTKLDDAELQKKFSDTSPQGREIIRKLGHKLLKATKS